ncbi:MAG TPA: glycosyltransferase family 2 protein [Solirubrobacteraceae bacterium]|jgi:GT2 family glycosyltransferase|nr:glycosyltransferase family 2 protein [Solirubrobacteraceae bacterium]
MNARAHATATMTTTLDSPSPAELTVVEPAPPRPDLSVIVVTHNRSDLALATLDSARAATGALEVQWLVIDSGSTDDTPEAIERRFPDLRVQRCQNIGFAAANNRALEQARGRYMLLLNPDVEIVSGTFAELVAALDERPGVGVASVIQQGPDGELQHTIRGFPSPWRAFGEALAVRWGDSREEQPEEARYREERSVDWLVGAFLLARTEAVDQIGGLDERFFLYSEETDWCYRAKAAGWDVRHIPRMVITHHCVPSTKPELVAQLSYAKLLFARKHYRRSQAAAVRVALAARHVVRVIWLTIMPRPDGASRARLLAERRAFAVVCGIAPPPFQ